MPSPAQVRALPAVGRVVVPPEWEDMNGHVNVRHHLGMYDETSLPMLELLGISERWVREGRVGIFDLEHHIWYEHEVLVGDEVGMFLRFTERNRKRVTGLVFNLNLTRDRLASVVEFVSASVDLDARRTVEWPRPIAARIDALLEAHAGLDWPAPRCGAISI
jgi:acyl-CoA thioester hydrolase